MAKLLSANDARQLTDLAKKKLAQEKRLARIEKEEQKKYRQLLQDGWGKQMTTMIAAAVKGSKSVNLKHPIYYFKILIQLDFKVYEVGWVKFNRDRRNSLGDSYLRALWGCRLL